MFDEQYTACLKWPDFPRDRFCPALHVYCGCALPLFRLFTSILQSANPKWFTIKVISSTVTLNVFNEIIYGTQKTPKKLLKKTWKQCRDGGWLTEVPVLLWWWAWILTQIDTGSPFPRGESPPRPEILPLWIIPPGRTKRQFCSDLWNDQHHISPMLLADRHHWLVPSPKDQSNPCVPTRKENSSLLRYLILYSLSCRLVPMEIRDTSSTRY